MRQRRQGRPAHQDDGRNPPHPVRDLGNIRLAGSRSESGNVVSLASGAAGRDDKCRLTDSRLTLSIFVSNVSKLARTLRPLDERSCVALGVGKQNDGQFRFELLIVHTKREMNVKLEFSFFHMRNHHLFVRNFDDRIPNK